jgi:hypothetical protein
MKSPNPENFPNAGTYVKFNAALQSYSLRGTATRAARLTRKLNSRSTVKGL